MKYMIKIWLVVLLILVVAPVGANALTFYLDQVNTNNTGTNGPWASVTLTDSTFEGKDSVHFEVDPIEGAFVSTGNNFGLQSFYFNENTSFGSSLIVGGFNATGWTFQYGSKNAGGGFGSSNSEQTGAVLPERTRYTSTSIQSQIVPLTLQTSLQPCLPRDTCLLRTLPITTQGTQQNSQLMDLLRLFLNQAP